MVKHLAGLDATFGALADSTRRAILARLARSEGSVTELARPFSMSLPAVSKHLHVLERAGLLTQERHGRIRRCRLVPGPIQTAAEWIAHYRKFWEERLDALEKYLKQPKEEMPWPHPRPRRRQRLRSRARSRRRARRSSAPGRTPRR